MALEIVRSVVAAIFALMLATWLARRYSKIQNWFWEHDGVYLKSSHIYASLTVALCWCLGMFVLWGVMWIFTYTL